MSIRAITPDDAARREASQRSSGRRLNGSVVHKIGFDIVSGTYPPGTLLADEVAFAEELEISRGAYREAMRVLAAKGLIESRPRAGTKVLERDRWNILDPDILAWAFSAEPDLGLIRDLFELRQIIEPAAAGLAASRRTTDHLKTLENALRSMRENGAHSPTGRAADRDFHRTILGETGNTALMNLGAGIAAAVDWTTRYKRRSRVIARDAVPDHARVYDAIVAGDGAEANARMRLLVEFALADTRSAVAARSHHQLPVRRGAAM